MLEKLNTTKHQFSHIEDFLTHRESFGPELQHYLDGVRVWLSMRTKSNNTHRAYLKESERFLLWCFYIHRKSPNQLEVEDVLEYSEFIANVKVTHPHWCGPRVVRNSEDWKPFYAEDLDGKLPGLCDASHDFAMAALTSLFSWLKNDMRVEKNPFKLAINKRKSFSTQANEAKAFSWREVRMVFKHIDSIEEKNQEITRLKKRNKWVFALLTMTGMRCEEIASSTFSSFMDKDGEYFLDVLGKGNKLRRIPINNYLLKTLVDYREFLGLTPIPAYGDKTPLVCKVRGNGHMGVRAINKLIKSILVGCANENYYYTHLAERLKNGSTHWFRGSFASELNNQNINQKTMQDLMGHSSAATTARYIRIDDRQKTQAVAKIRSPE